MKVAVVVDSHMFRTPDQKFWVKGITDSNFFKRYLDVFESVRVISRVKDITIEEAKGLLRVDGDNIEVFPLPFSRGMKEYAKNYFATKKKAKESTKGISCAIFRLPSVVSFLVLETYDKINKPFSIEVVADPDLVYVNNKIAHSMYTKKLKDAALKANGVSYVTREALQSKYPHGVSAQHNDGSRFAEHYSSIDLDGDFFSPAKTYMEKKSPFVITHTSNKNGTTEKGQDTLIKALGIINSKGYDVKLKFIGDSEIKDKFLELASQNGLENKVEFTGLLAHKSDVRSQLISSDIFVYPTRAEGLPRAVIEAMAVGLPVISTPVGGIPELISRDYLIDAESPEKFAEVIKKVLDAREILEEMSRENIEKAKEYQRENLQKRRNDFYGKLRSLVEEEN